MRQVTFILALACALAYLNAVQAECCRASLTMSYTINGGNCADAGGRGSGGDRCTITICADGRAQVGTFCGRRSCNIFGCACGGGCLSGNWKQSFLDNNQGRGITVHGESWNS
ncbi:hypothetical protein KR222_010770 [Zaprionus bogoriensis]|nr:hypothetical protein KR222_010770 [Zaprionus bogoriensis]